eukprot:CAMPEP_0170545906 /NCGR_PEP_ID=MMETSP0211-20121228/4268_1 /TAXON_ID=311385 /ORGANISM="Pseudokeronopsis sp., Strain OXSARD2" /LENGTH=66 /DNA_ID=CAMNT_0010850063 /DNA_START=964 /DNA_END=1164 /DNA_ORIENTATION=+
MDYVSLLGGLFNSLYAGGKLITYFFLESVILNKIMKGLFQYQLATNDVQDESGSVARAKLDCSTYR